MVMVHKIGKNAIKQPSGEKSRRRHEEVEYQADEKNHIG